MRVLPDQIINGFDSSYYLLTQPDLAAAGVDPLVHFNTFGWHEGRSPNALFDPAYYLAQNSDVAAAGVDPLQHYLAFGASEGRNPSALLNSSAYLAANPDVADAHVNPLQHYLQFGAFEGRSGGANLTIGTSGNDYLIGTSGNDGLDGGAGNDFVIAAGGNDTVNGGDGIDTARFSSDFSAYTFTFVENQVIVDGPEGHDVYTNFERFAFRDGTIERNDSNPLIDDLYYYAHNPDIWAAGMDAATHYAQFGWHEGRNPNLYFDTNYYLSNNPDVAAAGVDPLQHFLTFGGFEGRNPSALFDGAAYLALNPDVANAHVNTLLHFLQNGQSEGRSPVVPLFGDANPNSLVGTAGSDSLYGLGGNDQLQGLGGNDLLDGGTGYDRAIYTDAAGGITVNLAVGTVAGAGVGSDMLRNIEGVIGSDFADSFNATGFAGVSGNRGGTIGFNDFEGRGGDDVIIGGINGQGQALTRVSYLSATGTVTVDIAAATADGDASVGHDAISNIAGIWGSNSNDSLFGSNTAFGTFELFEGRGGDDFIDGRGGYDQVAYNSDPATTSGITALLAAGTVTGDTTVGTDTIRGVEAVRGTNFDDFYDATGFGSVGPNVGSSGNFNEFVGGGGNDTVTGNGFTRLGYSNAIGAVTVDLGGGTATGAGEGTDTFTGVNAVQGSVFADMLWGSSVSNTFTGLGGDDFIDGRGGFDTASYNSLGLATAGVSVSLGDGIAAGDASIGTDTLRDIEAVQGTGFADTFDATGYGLGGALNVSTSSGNFNQFEGLGGDDSITGNGNTRAIYFNSTAGVTITIDAGGAGSASGDGSIGNDSFIGGVNGATGSNFADVFDASGFNIGFNAFQGQGGNDTITGNGATQVQYGNATSGVTITIGAGGAGSASGDGSVGNDTFTGGVNSAIGGNLADSYNASGLVGSNFFLGQGGNDTIMGNGFTQIQYNNATGGVSVNLSTGTASGDASVGTDTITGGVHDVLGSNFNDTITGSSGNDLLNGLAGNDIITGGGGNDLLGGGAGADNFVFTSGLAAGATITDFSGNGSAAGDTLEFHGFGQAGATLTFLSGNQWQVHSGLDGHIELITIIGSVDVSDYQFLI